MFGNYPVTPNEFEFSWRVTVTVMYKDDVLDSSRATKMNANAKNLEQHKTIALSGNVSYGFRIYFNSAAPVCRQAGTIDIYAYAVQDYGSP